jgi:hypothetical protein
MEQGCGLFGEEKSNRVGRAIIGREDEKNDWKMQKCQPEKKQIFRGPKIGNGLDEEDNGQFVAFLSRLQTNPRGKKRDCALQDVQGIMQSSWDIQSKLRTLSFILSGMA